MLWLGTDKARFKIQRRIASVVLFIAVFFLAAQIEAWFSGNADFGDVLKGVFLTGFAGGDVLPGRQMVSLAAFCGRNVACALWE